MIDASHINSKPISMLLVQREEIKQWIAQKVAQHEGNRITFFDQSRLLSH